MLIFKRFKRAIPLPLPPYYTYTDLPAPVYEMVEKEAIKYWPPQLNKKKLAICAEVILLAAKIVHSGPIDLARQVRTG